MFQLSTLTVLLLLFCFYGLTFLVSLRVGRKDENVDGYMVSNNSIGFGMSAASMTATWIWAASFYAAASAGYKFGLSGALHYGFWGALMILFIYPFGRRFRQLAPKAHTLAEIMHARHGRSSQMILAGSNIVGSLISLMVNFTAAGALVAVLSPLSFTHGVLIAGVGILTYTIWSGFRSSVLTDFGQLFAMIFAAVVIIPIIFFQLGGPEIFAQGMPRITPEQASFYSKTAILEQGAPYFVAVLAYAIGNQTIAQRLFAVREDLMKSTFVTATIGYASIVIGLGMLGFLALLAGIEPQDGDLNNLIPQMASTYLPPFAVGLFFIMVIGSLSSTADSDLSALSALVMTDVYGKNIAKGKQHGFWIGQTQSKNHVVCRAPDHGAGNHAGDDFCQHETRYPDHADFCRRAMGRDCLSCYCQPVLAADYQRGLYQCSDCRVCDVFGRPLRIVADARCGGAVLRTLCLDRRRGGDWPDGVRLFWQARGLCDGRIGVLGTGAIRVRFSPRLPGVAQFIDRLRCQHRGVCAGELAGQ